MSDVDVEKTDWYRASSFRVERNGKKGKGEIKGRMG
jgi:hypothetical protein